jgi:DNA (cytosine-5)-methyltransferase 1
MLQPRELYGCQGFPAHYIINRRPDGTTLSKSAQTRMCGNSVSPLPMAALVRANFQDVALRAAA